MTKRRIALLLTAIALTAAPVAWGYRASADDGPVEPISNAQTAIEALPYPFTFIYPPRGRRHALIIRITDKLGRSFRFFHFAGNAPLDIGIAIRPETTSLPIRSYSGNSGITKAMETDSPKSSSRSKTLSANSQKLIPARGFEQPEFCAAPASEAADEPGAAW